MAAMVMRWSFGRKAAAAAASYDTPNETIPTAPHHHGREEESFENDEEDAPVLVSRKEMNALSSMLENATEAAERQQHHQLEVFDDTSTVASSRQSAASPRDSVSTTAGRRFWLNFMRDDDDDGEQKENSKAAADPPPPSRIITVREDSSSSSAGRFSLESRRSSLGGGGDKSVSGTPLSTLLEENAVTTPRLDDSTKSRASGGQQQASSGKLLRDFSFNNVVPPIGAAAAAAAAGKNNNNKKRDPPAASAPPPRRRESGPPPPPSVRSSASGGSGSRCSATAEASSPSTMAAVEDSGHLSSSEGRVIVPEQAARQQKSESTKREKSASPNLKTAANNATARGVPPKLKSSTPSPQQQRQVVVQVEDPFLWAYEVWVRKGLLDESFLEKKRKVSAAAKGTAIEAPSSVAEADSSRPTAVREDDSSKPSARQDTKKSNVTSSSQRDPSSLPGNDDPVPTDKKRHSSSAAATTTNNINKKPGNSLKSFANILEQWRTISDDKPCSHFLSPEQNLPAVSEYQKLTEQKKKEAAARRRRQTISAAPQQHSTRDATLSDVESKSSQSPVNESSGKSTTSSSFDIRQRRKSIAALPNEASRGGLHRKEATGGCERSSSRSPSHLSPKLKIMRQKLREMENKAASTSNFRRYQSPPKSRGDFKTVVQDVLRDASAEQQPKGSSVSALRFQDRSKSAARGGRPDNGMSSVAAIRSKLKRESASMRESLPAEDNHHRRTSSRCVNSIPSSGRRMSVGSTSKRERVPVRVKDLEISNIEVLSTSGSTDDSIPFEVCIANSASTDISEMGGGNRGELPPEFLSPQSERIVQNLNRAVAGVKQVSPKKGESYLERPWRRDSLLKRVDSLGETSAEVCPCSVSVLAGNDEMIEFFLPLMASSACTCGKQAVGLRNANDPTSLENMLRPWQVEFLAGFGIQTGDQFVKAYHRSADSLAAALRQHRKKHGMTPFRTKSCALALQIWAKTAKAFVRSIRHQVSNNVAGANLKLPNTLYILSSFLDKLRAHQELPPGDQRRDQLDLTSPVGNSSREI